MVQIEGVNTAKELVSLIKSEILKEMEEKGYLKDIEGIKTQKKRDQVLRKRWLKVNDLFEGQVWGDISRKQITRILKTLPANEYRFNKTANKPYYEVSQNAAKIKAAERGIL